MTKAIDMGIVELLASKICHDLISPVGAINNGIEILEEMGAEAGPDVTELIAFSANQASAKLKAFRMAYGAGGADTNLKPDDVFKTLETLLQGDARITQSWDPRTDIRLEDYPKGYCKILLCLFLLAVECLPKGGRISAQSDADGATTITGEGKDAALKEPMKEALSRQVAATALETRNVHAYVTAMLADHYGFNIEIPAAAENTVRFSFQAKSA